MILKLKKAKEKGMYEVLFSIVLFMAFVFFIYKRRPDALLNAQPWAEDGKIFISEFLFNGWQSLFISYAGYYHLIPRIVTGLAIDYSLAVYNNISIVPFIMNLTSIIFSSLCLVYFASSRFEWIAPKYLRVFASLLIILMPNSSYEVFSNITNIQWWFGLIQILLAWDILVNEKFPSKIELLLIVMWSFSGPFGVMVSFSLFINFILKRNWESFYYLSITSVGTLVQVFTLFFGRIEATDIKINHFYESISNLFFSGILSRLLLFNLSDFVNQNGFIISNSIGILLLILIFFLNYKKKKDLVLLLILLFIYLFMVLYGSPETITYYLSPFSDRFGGRYLFLPMVLFIILLFKGIHLTWENKKAVLISFLVVLLLSVVGYRNRHLEPFIDFKWAESTEVMDIGGSQHYTVAINPMHWYMEFPVR